MNAVIDALKAALPKIGQPLKTGKRGRPAFAATFEAVANELNRGLPQDAQRIANAHPYLVLAALNNARRPLTRKEIDALALTTDAQYQGLRNGEPIQTEERIGFDVAVRGNEELADALSRLVQGRVASAAQALANELNAPVYIRFVRWALARSARVDSDDSNGRVPASLVGLPALYQGKVYVTDSDAKEGFLDLGTVYPRH